MSGGTGDGRRETGDGRQWERNGSGEGKVGTLNEVRVTARRI